MTGEPSIAGSEPDGAPRLLSLDVLRGVAILGILFMNINEMGGSFWASWVEPRHFGWTLVDRSVWAVREVLAEGTARALLEMLFGAGMVILTDRAAGSIGETPAVRRYVGRNLVLLGFGIVHMLVLLWPGDILHSYAIAALMIVWFRGLEPGQMLAIGLWLTVTELIANGVALIDPGAAVTVIDHARDIALEDAARMHDFGAWAGFLWGIAATVLAAGEIETVLEAAGTMLVGAALYRWGVLQGGRSRRFYVALMVVGYGIGFPVRIASVAQEWAGRDVGRGIDMLYEVSRLATTLGHIGMLHLLLGTAVGVGLLRPFAAAGRTALTLYMVQSVLCLWVLYPPFALGLYGTQGWAAMMATALVVNAVLLVAANWWVARFRIAPVEWAWRSLAEGRRLPFR
ncbi:hypothetical protein ASG07_13340 [Sphingomonas sp. Leaf343]|nr:hypothetical protein ASG07_13340 [Sphingomonas sp. Leaf343]